MNANKSFHPNLIINDHFDDIKNQIDIKTETLHCGQNLIQDDRQILNDLRQQQLNKIDEMKSKNLSLVKYDEDKYKSKWNHVLANVTLTFEQKQDILKKELIVFDCILIRDDNYKSGISIWIMPFFCNQIHLKFIRFVFWKFFFLKFKVHIFLKLISTKMTRSFILIYLMIQYHLIFEFDANIFCNFV